jgi:transaldolase
LKHGTAHPTSYRAYPESSTIMKTTTVQFDERAQTEIEKLKKVFGATTNAAVIRKALALAALAAEEADDSHSVTISGRTPRKPVRVSLST